MLEAGRALGYRLKIHAEELAHTGDGAGRFARRRLRRSPHPHHRRGHRLPQGVGHRRRAASGYESLEPEGCDLLVLDSETHQELPYHWGVNLVTGVVAGGEVVVRDRQVVRAAAGSALAASATSPADGGPA